MQYIADLHLHSHYSRATAKQMNALDLYKWAQIKGIDLIGTGDFTHPRYFEELKGELIEAADGLYSLKQDLQKNYLENIPLRREPYFIFTTEISCIYSKTGKVRRIHIMVWASGIGGVEKINERLSRIGNLSADGRPIFGADVKNVSQIIWEADPSAIIIPAHAWTPWFSIFGSKSGFDSIEECFEDLSYKITAIETGLSSDPVMNACLSKLENINLVSNSDAHSPQNLGREATVFEVKSLSFSNILTAVKNIKREENFIDYTIEFFPQEGKYHWDGHRDCSVLLSPQESRKLKNMCPKCHSPLTIGVESRVLELSDKALEDVKPKKFVSIVPLPEIIAQSLNLAKNSKKVQGIYLDMVKALGTEFNILLNVPIDEIRLAGFDDVASGIELVRRRKIKITPGYDGVYGVVDVFGEKKLKKAEQTSLF